MCKLNIGPPPQSEHKSVNLGPFLSKLSEKEANRVLQVHLFAKCSEKNATKVFDAWNQTVLKRNEFQEGWWEGGTTTKQGQRKWSRKKWLGDEGRSCPEVKQPNSTLPSCGGLTRSHPVFGHCAPTTRHKRQEWGLQLLISDLMERVFVIKWIKCIFVLFLFFSTSKNKVSTLNIQTTWNIQLYFPQGTLHAEQV